MATIASWLAFILVVGQLWAIGSGRIKLSWYLTFGACACWMVFAVKTLAFALIAQQIVITFLAVRGLRKLNETTTVRWYRGTRFMNWDKWRENNP